MTNQAMHVRPAAILAAVTLAAASGCVTQQDAPSSAKAPELPEAPIARATVDALPHDTAREAFERQAAVASAAKPLPAAQRPSAMPFLDATLPTESPKQVAAAAATPKDDAIEATKAPPVASETPAAAAPAPAAEALPAPTPLPAPVPAERPAEVKPPEPAPAPVAPEARPAPAATPAPAAAPVPVPAPAPADAKPADAPASDGTRVMPAQPAPTPEILPEPSRPQRSRTDAPATPPVDESAMLRAAASKPAEPKPAEPKPADAKPAEAAPAAVKAAPVQPADAAPAAPTPAAKPTDAAPAPTVHVLRPALATKVRGFGDLDVAGPGALHAGDRVVAYFELGDWSAPVDADGRHVLRVRYSLRLRDASGTVVWTDGPIDATDAQRTVRRDLFITRLVRLPATLPVGSYALEFEASDPATGAVDMASVRFGLSGPRAR